MTDSDSKNDLQRYLQRGRDALLWKLEGLSEYNARRPLTSTGTNVLGLIKHVASVEAGYLGDVFGRPWPEELPWLADDAEPNADIGPPKRNRGTTSSVSTEECGPTPTSPSRPWI